MEEKRYMEGVLESTNETTKIRVISYESGNNKYLVVTPENVVCYAIKNYFNGLLYISDVYEKITY